MARLLNKLSTKGVQHAKPKDKNCRLSDGGNLYLLIKTNGRKYWDFRYKRQATGKVSYLGMGPYPDVSLAEAREKAQEMRKLLREGIDPQILKAQKKAALKEETSNTFSAVAELWMKSKRNRLKPKTIEGNWRKLELYAFPTLGMVPVTKITAPIAISTLKPVEKVGHLETVKRTAQLMNEVMNYAVNSGLVHANPLVGIKEVFQKPQVKHMHALEPHEITQLLQTVASANIQLTTRCLIEWQLHTITRPSEASGARWEEIDFENNLWVIPETRMKMKRQHEIPLTDQTLSILDFIKPISGHRKFIFPSVKDPRRSTDAETINRALGRMGFKGRTTAHGLRSLASTTLNEQGFDADVIEAALAHMDKNRIRAAYNRSTYLDRRRQLKDWWSNYIENASFGSLSVIGKTN